MRLALKTTAELHFGYENPTQSYKDTARMATTSVSKVIIDA